MHPEVKSTSMGKCPECGMFLKTVDNNAVAKTMKEGDSHDESAQKHGCC
jgi:transcription initiation factor IIE alpha subunit